MPKSKILAITELAENQAQAFTTVNEMIAGIEAAENKTLSLTLIATTIISQLQAYRYKIFQITSSPGSAIMEFPQYTDSPVTGITPTAFRLFAIDNQVNATITLRTAASSGPESLVILPFEKALVYQVNKKFTALFAQGGGGVGSTPFTAVTFIPGVMPAPAELLRFIATETIVFQDNFGGSRGTIGTNPTATVTLNVNKNGALIGTIAISTGGVFTFNTTGAGVETFVLNDILTIVAPVLDTTAANISITLKGTR